MPKRPVSHVCDERCMVLNRDYVMVCTVTGRCFSRYMSRNFHNNDSSEMFVTCRPAKPRAAQEQPRPTPPDRNKLAAEVDRVYGQLMTGAARRQLESESDADATVASVHHRKRRRVGQVPEDAELRERVVAAVQSVAETVIAHKPFQRALPVIIGALYLMQHGKSFTSATGKRRSIPRYGHLQRYLPSISDLPALGYNRSMVRVGKNVIMAALRA